MIVARLEVFTSLPLAPTRRVALGSMSLPTDPAPGYGGALLAGVVARFAPSLTVDQLDEVDALRRDLSAGARPVQPRARHRLQSDRVGLKRCRHRLVAEGPTLRFRFEDERGTPIQHVLGAIYAAAAAAPDDRSVLLDAVAAGLRWAGPVDARFILALASTDLLGGVHGDAVLWARRTLGIDLGETDRQQVQRAFRERLRSAHPDHGAEHAGAAERIAELNEARRILLATAS